MSEGVLHESLHHKTGAHNRKSEPLSKSSETLCGGL